MITPDESQRFLDAAQQLSELTAGDLGRLNVELPEKQLAKGRAGIF
jgi:hypothetical protein